MRGTLSGKWQPASSNHPGSGRCGGPRDLGGGNRSQHSPRIRLGIPIASHQKERHEATIRTRVHDAEILEILITPN